MNNQGDPFNQIDFNAIVSIHNYYIPNTKSWFTDHSNGNSIKVDEDGYIIDTFICTTIN